jgi:hypothetical protein
MARAAVATEGLVGQFGDVRTTHDHRDSRSTNGIGYAISLGNHSGHGANADQPDFLIADLYCAI